jgi:hypothetical protein
MTGSCTQHRIIVGGPLCRQKALESRHVAARNVLALPLLQLVLVPPQTAELGRQPVVPHGVFSLHHLGCYMIESRSED